MLVVLLSASAGHASERTSQAPPSFPARVALTFEERVAAHRAIEEVFWKRRTWPVENNASKPSIDQVLPQETSRERVRDGLAKSAAIRQIWGWRVSASEVEGEVRRMAHRTRSPEVLRELFAALGNDPTRIGECLARPILEDRLLRSAYARDPGFHGTLRASLEARLASTNGIAEDDALEVEAVSWSKVPFERWWREIRASIEPILPDGPTPMYAAVEITGAPCPDDTWTEFDDGAPDPRFGHTAIWTGAEMVVWGGWSGSIPLDTGARYDPATDTWTPISRDSSTPAPRSGHSAVWTGTEMIVWGGRDQSSPSFSSGGRYDPVTGIWRTVSASNAPSGRTEHTAVWGGSAMIVWGGYGGPTGVLGSGGRYDPVTDSWLPTSDVAAPAARRLHTAIWSGSRMIVWGGDNGSAAVATGGLYDPVSNTWQPTSTGPGCPAARTSYTAVWTGTEMIVWSIASGGRYDPLTDGWRAIGPSIGAPDLRIEHSAVWTGTEMIVWGGWDNSSTFFDTGWRYDPQSDEWSATDLGPGTPSPRRLHSAIWTGTEMIVWGGLRLFSPGFNTGGRYDPSTGSWLPTSVEGGPPSARSGAAATWTGAEFIVWGGSDVERDFDTGKRYTPATDSWTPLALDEQTPYRRSRSVVVWTGREMILWGGSYQLAYYPYRSVLSDGGRYDPTTDSWRYMGAAPNRPSSRDNATTVWTGREMIVWGGLGNGFDLTGFDTGGRFDPATDTWRSTTQSGAPAGRFGHTAVWTGREMIVWGGSTKVAGIWTYFDSGARYDPASDAWVATPAGADAPIGRRYHTAVWIGSEMLLWGGVSATGYPSAGGRYEPRSESWSPIPAASPAPVARQDLVGVWTGGEMIVWGGTNGTVLSSGGRYDPVQGSWRSTSSGPFVPAPRYFANGAWTGRDLLVFGGFPLTSRFSVYCASSPCSAPPWYDDADGDGYGDPRDSVLACTQPPGYAETSDDCDDSRASAHPGAAELCNGLDDDCDAETDESSGGVDSDFDGVPGACDDCPSDYNPTQIDLDHDGEGDACDLDDGTILVRFPDPAHLEWQPEAGFEAWNVYRGDLDVLRESGTYTQVPGSNPLASRICRETLTTIDDTNLPAVGKTEFSLVTGVHGVVEGSLGSDGAGIERPNTNPCP